MHQGKITGVDVQMPPDNAVVINCGGMLLLPGTLWLLGTACQAGCMLTVVLLVNRTCCAASKDGQVQAEVQVELLEADPCPECCCTWTAGLCDAHVHVTATTANLAGLFR